MAAKLAHRPLTVPALGVSLVAASLGCLDPTEAIVDIHTNGACSAIHITGITAGKKEMIEAAEFDTTTDQCDKGGEIGSIVLLPDGAQDAPFAFKVVTSLGSTPVEQCTAPLYGPSCIVARRSMHFVPHHFFHVPVSMNLACAGVLCPEDQNQTCVDGTCVNADLDPDACDAPGGCDLGPDDTLPWQKQIGGPGSQMALEISRAADGTLIVTGNFTKDIDPGGGALTSMGQNDIFLAAYAPTGAIRWAKSFGGTGDDYGIAAAIARSGDTYVLGSFENTVDFGGGDVASNGLGDMVLMKVDAVGKFVWAVRIGGEGLDTGGKLAVDQDDNVYMTGAFSSELKLAGNAFTSAGSTDVLIASFTPGGELRWAKTLGGLSEDWGNGISVDGERVYVGGSFRTKAALDKQTLIAVAGADAFVASFDRDGAYRWVKTFGSPGQDTVFDLAAGGGRVVATGTLSSDSTLEGKPLAATKQDGFVIAFESDGELAWSRVFGSDEGYEQGTAVDIGLDGSVFLGGSITRGPAFQGPILKDGGERNPFAAVLDFEGNPRWIRQLVTSVKGEASGIAASPDGYAILAGWFTDKLELGDETFTAEAEDMLLMRIAPTKTAP